MPWPKGVPHTPEMIEKRVRTWHRNAKHYRKPNSLGQWECCTCHLWKDAAQFYKDRRTSSGLKAQCKKCHSRMSIASRDLETSRANKRRCEASRRARRANTKGNVSKPEYQALENAWGSTCLKCGSTTELQWDHVIPLARGGAHCISNLQRLCRVCNERKQAHTADYRSDEQKVWVYEFKRTTE